LALRFTVLTQAIGKRNNIMDRQTAQTWLNTIETKRDLLVRLLEQPDLGTLRIDVNQALEEMDDLIVEFRRTFPPEPLFS
jgi:peptide subunit release factor 1 (eRF1)